MSRRRIFVGDVHGCADELDELLAKLAHDPERDELWLTGDVVNRGPASLRALRRVRELRAGFVLGNHDLALLETAAGVRGSKGRDTFRDILEADDRDELLASVRARPLLAEWNDVVLVHAGLHPRWTDPAAAARRLEARLAAGELPQGDPDLAFFTRVRLCDADGRMPTRDEDEAAAAARYAPWDSFYRGDRTVVFGHWALRGLDRTERTVALDSGCVWGGALSAWIAEEDRIVSVPARRQYQSFG